MLDIVLTFGGSINPEKVHAAHDASPIMTPPRCPTNDACCMYASAMYLKKNRCLGSFAGGHLCCSSRIWGPRREWVPVSSLPSALAHCWDNCNLVTMLLAESCCLPQAAHKRAGDNLARCCRPSYQEDFRLCCFCHFGIAGSGLSKCSCSVHDCGVRPCWPMVSPGDLRHAVCLLVASSTL